MPIKTSWLIPKRLIFVDMPGEVTLEDFQAFDLEMLELLNEGTKPVFVIADTREMSVNVNPMQIKRELDHITHENLGWINLVGGNAGVRFLSSVVFKLSNAPVRYHLTWENAILYIHDIDSSIPKVVEYPTTA